MLWRRLLSVLRVRRWGKDMDARDERLGRHIIMGTDHNAHTSKQDQIDAAQVVG